MLGLLLFIVALITTVPAAIILPDGTHFTSPFAGTTFWQNQLGSNVTFIAQDGFLRGYYSTAVDNEQPPKEPLPLTGQLTEWKPGQLVAWSVNFNTKPPSMAVWNGYCDSKSTLLHTHWILTEQTGTWWNTTMMGDDTFRKLGPLNTTFLVNNRVFHHC
jgi:hypothetical protein